MEVLETSDPLEDTHFIKQEIDFGSDDSINDVKFDTRNIESDKVPAIPDGNIEIPEIKYDNSTCPICNETLLHVTYVQHLRKEHPNSNIYPCQLCGSKSIRIKYLLKHIKNKHIHPKVHGCRYCEYSTLDMQTLKRHENSIHTKSRLYPCEQCDYKATTSLTLRRHVENRHINIKPFLCDFCEYRAVRVTTLKRHFSAVHMKEKNHKCPLCKYGAIQASTLKIHMKTHEPKEKRKMKPETAVTCKLCNLVCKRKSGLTKHLRQKHTLKSSPQHL